VAVSEAARIAARNLVHRRLSNALLVLLIGFSVLSYLATSLFAADTRGGMVTSLDLGLDRALLVRLRGWSFLETRYLDHPLASERPRTETDYLCLLTEEQGGPLDTIRRHASVDQVWIARLVTLQLPWGTGDLLSVEEKAPPLADVKFVSGRPPGTLREIAVPEDIAVLAGLKPGSQVSYLATDTEKESAAFSEGTLVVSGVFRPGSLFFRGAVGWLPSSYPSSYVTDLWAHYPRVLENFEPNCYLVTLQERADVRMFAEWLVETWYQDHRGHWHIQPRYPVLSLWSNDVANEFLGQGLSLGTTALSGIIGLSLVFVGIGTLTILLLAFMERRREVAILKAVGLSGGDIALIFALEVSYVAILGMAIGLGLAALVLKAWLGTPIDWRLAVRSAAVTALVLYLSSMLPVAMARSATVAELLSGQRVIAIFRSRVGAIGAPAARRFRARRPGA
jgi:hypothetical protein